MATQKGRNWSSGDIVTAANLSSVERGVSAVSSLYEPTTWANGDTVTAAALNNIEQGIVNADGGSQSWVTLCEEEVTTEEHNGMYRALLSYSQLISADTIRVTFNGNEYMCENISSTAGIYAYGGVGETGLDFSEYPFAIISRSSPNAEVVNQIATETSGTHTVKIEALQESGSSDFSTAQVSIVNNSSSELSSHRLAIVYPEDEELLTGFSLDPISQSIFNVVLYKGKAIIDALYKGGVMIMGTDISVSGNIENLSDEYEVWIVITGDCTITISDESSGGSPK